MVYTSNFMVSDRAWTRFDFRNQRIPWTRPTVRVVGRSVVQPRDTCYVASPGLTTLAYSGCKPLAYTWDDFPPRRYDVEPPRKKSKKSSEADTHSFVLKHGSLLVMKGYTQRGWVNNLHQPYFQVSEKSKEYIVIGKTRTRDVEGCIPCATL